MIIKPIAGWFTSDLGVGQSSGSSWRSHLRTSGSGVKGWRPRWKTPAAKCSNKVSIWPTSCLSWVLASLGEDGPKVLGSTLP